VDPKVTQTITKVVDRELKDLAAKDILTMEGVRKHFRKIYPKIWYPRKPWRSVSDLIKERAEMHSLVVSSNVRLELSKLYTSLTADTLFAAAAFAVLTRGRRNPITLDDVELVCKNFQKMPKPTWLC
jgi:hypothetical protein